MVFRALFDPIFGRRNALIEPPPKGERNGDAARLLSGSELVPIGLPFDEAMRRLAAGRKMVLASNRGPVEFLASENGAQQVQRGSGGLCTILSEMARSISPTWVVSPMGEGDRRACTDGQNGRMRPGLSGGLDVELRFVLTPQVAYDRYYGAIANPLLWNLHHYLFDLGHGPTINAAVYDAWEHGYVAVNRAYADAILQEIDSPVHRGARSDRRDQNFGISAGSASSAVSQGGGEGRPVVLFQDYHLYLAPGYVRERAPEAVLQHFIHIPWPAPRYWLLLPEAMRLPILRSMCQNDIVGFQTRRDVMNFLSTCEAYLPDASIDFGARSLQWRDRTVYLRSYPVSIDPAAVQEAAASAEAVGYREMLERLRGDQTIVRVDRLEPSKNIVRGFLAFDGLLNRCPELAGRVKFWAFLVPSRSDLKQYQEYRQEVFDLIDQINQRHGNDAWKPIEVFYENNYVQALVGMSLYDVLLVNPVIDGMNLVAKEGPTVNQRDGVLVLSEGAGAHAQLGRYALSVAATDIEGTIRALHEALTMAAAERAYRAQGLRKAVASEDLQGWIQAQAADLLGLLGQ